MRSAWACIECVQAGVRCAVHERALHVCKQVFAHAYVLKIVFIRMRLCACLFVCVCVHCCVCCMYARVVLDFIAL